MRTPPPGTGRTPGAALLPLALGLAFCLNPARILAQGRTVYAVDTVRTAQPWPPHAEYSFPRLVIPARPEVAERINRHLAIDFLEADPDTAGNDLFSLVWGDTATARPPSLYDLTWEVHQPLAEVVDFELTGEGCGAYCEGFTRHYLYDLRDGSYLAFDSLFTPAGLVAVNDTLDKLWRAVVSQQILTIEDTLSTRALSVEDQEWFRESVELYRNCRDERPRHAPYVEDIVPLPQIMRFHIARCSAHVNRNVDDLYTVEVQLPFSWLATHFRPELRSLFR